MNMNNIIKFGAKYKEILFYIVFGVLTTAVNWIIFQICIEIFSINWSIANVIAWVGAVIFAYITNRKIVFESQSPHIIREFIVFVQFRLVSLVIEMLIMFLFIEVLFVAPFPSKIVTSVVVVIANYIFSKAVIFKKRG